jgi:uncharacterized protein
MPSTVFFGSAWQARLTAHESLPLKLDRILEGLHLRERVKGEEVAIKIHIGGNVCYSTIHPVLVRRVVQAVKDGGGIPFVADHCSSTATAAERGYTAETLGCPIFPVAGPNEKHFHAHRRPYKNIMEWGLAGAIEEASFLIDLAHVKGHPICSYAGAIKNLALGCMIAPTRSQIHDSVQYDRYWFKERCPDAATRQAIIAACPFGALVQDTNDPEELHLHVENCNQCGRCLELAPPGALKVDPVNFATFQEANAIAAGLVLDTFASAKAIFLNVATHMTPMCDCYGFTTLPVFPDIGIFGSDDIVAVEQATLDAIGRYQLLEENLPLDLPVVTREGHPFQWFHGPYKSPYLVTEFGEGLGLGTRTYEMLDIMPVVPGEQRPPSHIPAKSM